MDIRRAFGRKRVVIYTKQRLADRKYDQWIRAII